MLRDTRFHLYDVADAIVPGAVFVLGLIAIAWTPTLDQLAHWTLGSTVLFLVISYAAGQLAQIVGTVLEGGWWRVQGGMPVDWLRSGARPLLPPEQVRAIELRLAQRLSLAPDFKLSALSAGSWYYMVRQVATIVERTPEQAKLDALQGQYRIARGLAAVLLALCCILALVGIDRMTLDDLSHEDMIYFYCAALAGPFSMLALYRMQRFGVQYALELFAAFMIATGEPAGMDVTVPTAL